MDKNALPSEELLSKYNKLKDYLASLRSVAVAFSGGVDSTFLLYAAREALGENVTAFTASLMSFPEREMSEALSLSDSLGVRNEVIVADEYKIEGFINNPENRCYLCKRNILEKIIDKAHKMEIDTVIEGSIVDDLSDDRPGHKAIKELGVISPLIQAGLTKEEIRILSKHFSLPTYNKPSYSCLYTRIPHGDKITDEKLRMIDEAEVFILGLGFSDVRVRFRDGSARIEVPPDETAHFTDENVKARIDSELKRIGFDFSKNC